MVEKRTADYSEPAVPADDRIARFEEAFESELTCISARRKFLSWKYPEYVSPPTPDRLPDRRKPVLEATGLALSGGGIRSAAFCLGVLQALDATPGKPKASTKKTERKPTLLERVDYLSTVSGGGYIGSSLSVGMSMRAGLFPFRSRLDQEETDSVKHIRDYSNYLCPNGWLDALDSFAIYLRGLLSNFLIVLGPLLILVTLTIFCSPLKADLSTPKRYRQLISGIFGYVPDSINFDSFCFTRLIFLIGLALFLLWGLTSIFERLARFEFWSVVTHALGVVGRTYKYLRERIVGIFKGSAAKMTWHQVITGDGVVRESERPSETGSRWVRTAGFVLALLLFSAFCEAQPWVLDWLIKYKAPPADNAVATGSFKYWVEVIAALYALLASAVSLFADKFAKLARLSERASGWLARGGHYTIRVAIYLASAAVPLLIWWLYLELCLWGIARERACSGPEAGFDCFGAPNWLYRFAYSAFADQKPVLSGLTHWFASFGDAASSWLGGLPLLPSLIGNIGIQIAALLDVIQSIVKFFTDWAIKSGTLIGGVYMLLAIVLFLLALIPALNANSLHRLYRDRLSVAFVFYESLPSRGRSWLEFASVLTSGLASGLTSVVRRLTNPADAAPNETPDKKADAEPAAEAGDESGADAGHVPVVARSATPSVQDGLTPLYDFKLSTLSARYGPYHIINTALNIQGSKYANQRARNAEFFMFSRNFTGSEATGFVATQRMEQIDSNLDVATAMAVSGAAASSNMGSNTVRSLTPTLTILNIRLGYWLRNPLAAVGLRAKRFLVGLAEMANVFFYLEMFGLLDEKSYNIYLTDGGHIENLGIYELLKRRCKLIIAVDAEADPGMTFSSLVTLQRYARIDLGTRIELPWQAIRNMSLEVSKKIEESAAGIPDCDGKGPHAAIGTIEYPHGGIGYLLYIKASMSGDENDYIIDYKRRNKAFPHESTGDQFFSEEQFEAYRALGFHAAFRIFSGKDQICTFAPDAERPKMLKWDSADSDHNPLPEIRALLRL